ncbi:MAG: right-handed parallel beta-helix repeat-containing protein [Bryobacterales bacterium]|nr:right-handed parallel beta-helix repeat-containing protein [Bryobacterales bacterium]
MRALRTAVLLAHWYGALAAQEREPVEIFPGTPVQPLVDQHPEGTLFYLRAGVHRLQSITPKNGQRFLGEDGAVLNGAVTVGGFTSDGPQWRAFAAPSTEAPHGDCNATHPRCRVVNDVFVDGVPLTPAASRMEVDAAHYFLDAAARALYLGFDPTGRVVEMATAATAFSGRAADVLVRGLVIEKYANRAQLAVVAGGDGARWTIMDNTVRYNHGVGIVGGPNCVVRGNRVLWNGQLGVAADGAHGLFEDNEIAFNNYRGYYARWEGGGSKFAETADLVVRRNHVHDNFGFGLWTDIDNIRTVYEDNLVTGNEESGIFHEISGSAVIRNNYVARNARGVSQWLWGAQILLSNSWDVEVTGNIVVVDAAGGNGIAMVQQDRGVGPLGLRSTRNNTVTANRVVYEGAAGLSGIAADFDEVRLLNAGNRFDRNRYELPSEPQSPRRWIWGQVKDWHELLASGQELNGAFETTVPNN